MTRPELVVFDMIGTTVQASVGDTVSD